ncbi:hypothetical protein POP15_194 [Pectobacterium phage POP15]|nr:hypothetical protein POP15_194 [Pectobacterium phage POP15]
MSGVQGLFRRYVTHCLSSLFKQRFILQGHPEKGQQESYGEYTTTQQGKVNKIHLHCLTSSSRRIVSSSIRRFSLSISNARSSSGVPKGNSWTRPRRESLSSYRRPSG